MLNWIKDKYNNIPVYITENGYPDDTGTLDDFERVNVLSRYISEVLKGTAILISVIKLKTCELLHTHTHAYTRIHK